MKKILLCGSRGYGGREVMEARMAQEDPDNTIWITGNAPGADELAERIALERGLFNARMRAPWKRLQKRAGLKRNEAMQALGPDLVVAFWDGSSPGTRNMIDLALGAGIPVEVITHDRPLAGAR